MPKWTNRAKWVTYDYVMPDMAYRGSLDKLIMIRIEDSTTLIKRATMERASENLGKVVMNRCSYTGPSFSRECTTEHHIGSAIVGIDYLPTGFKRKSFDPIPGAIIIEERYAGKEGPVNWNLICLADELELPIPLDVEAEYLESFRRHLLELWDESYFIKVETNGRKGGDLQRRENELIEQYEADARRRGASLINS